MKIGSSEGTGIVLRVKDLTECFLATGPRDFWALVWRTACTPSQWALPSGVARGQRGDHPGRKSGGAG